MPCFKGIAVSIHANGAPLAEYGVQKQSRVSRMNTYISVPQPQLSGDSNKPEPAKFAISITLLTPGLAIPYSTPRPSKSNPNPKPQYVGSLPSITGERGRYHGVVSPYIPMTNSENETIAAYIYFDGRAKEEVATLLRPGEETWVNSRWVQVPEPEGGGLAEREFLFREVGLERWLNGLDLQGHDAAEKLERRRQKFERRRRRQQRDNENGGSSGSGGGVGGGGSGGLDMDMEVKPERPRDTFRYGTDDGSPVEAIFDGGGSASESDDEPPQAAGQIKVAMFRVIASGEIKKGEYSPQFDAHDDDDEGTDQNGRAGIDADLEHTTSFAKPKTLDPKTISTQTVTGIDGPEKPFATFTFFYRGERQLQKMGVLPSSKNQQATPITAKRRSGQLDFSNLGPLSTGGTVGFSAFRDGDTASSRQRKSRKKSNGALPGSMDEDSDDEDEDTEILGKIEDLDDKDPKSNDVGPEDTKFSGELAEGVNRIRLKRAYEAEQDSRSVSPVKSPSTGPLSGDVTPPEGGKPIPPSSSLFGRSLPDESTVGSPMKKARPSISAEEDIGQSAQQQQPPPRSFPSGLGDVLAKAEANASTQGQKPSPEVKGEIEEEL